MTAPLKLPPGRTESAMDIRRHQIRRQVHLEQRADYFERLSIELTDPQGRAEALALSVHYAARANVLRNAVSLTNFLIPETADEEKRRLDREAAE